MIVRQSVSPALIGCVIGTGGAAAVGQMIRSQMSGVSAIDLTAFSASTLALLLTMTIASLAPARRAARVDPIQVLRTE